MKKLPTYGPDATPFTIDCGKTPVEESELLKVLKMLHYDVSSCVLSDRPNTFLLMIEDMPDADRMRDMLNGAFARAYDKDWITVTEDL